MYVCNYFNKHTWTNAHATLNEVYKRR